LFFGNLNKDGDLKSHPSHFRDEDDGWNLLHEAGTAPKETKEGKF